MKTSFSLARTRVFLVFLVLMGSYHLTFNSYFLLPNGLMGHDYVLTIGGFLDGFIWFRNNGIFSAPWFTPSFCGGQPFFADPQSAYYSIPQWLTFFVDPVQAVYISFLLFAGIGFWGMYFCSVKVFGMDKAGALVAATVFMFNGFYAHRMIVGHYGYQSFMLVPLIACLLLSKPEKFPPRIGNALFSVLAGVLIAYWFHSGLTTLIIPAALAIVALACIVSMKQGGVVKGFVIRGTMATVVALGLCASKLNANLTLMGGIQRDYYPLPGLANWYEIPTFVFKSLFYSSEHVFRWVTPLWKNIQWSAMPHELAYGLTPIVALIIIAGLARSLFRLQEDRAIFHQSPDRPTIFVALVGLTAILVIPLMLLYYSPAWNAVLKGIPLVGSTTSPFRWLIIYIPLICVLAGITTASSGKMKLLLAGLCIAGVPLLNALESRNYYEEQRGFDPEPYVEFHRMLKSGSIQPRILAIADPHTEDGFQIIDNGQFLKGFSPIRCYNPLFGYRQENLVTKSLQAGSIDLEVSPGKLNMHNPACLIFPAENSCSKWDSFRKIEGDKLDDFASYRPFQFTKSIRQQVADWATILTMLCLLLFALITGFVTLRKKTR